MTSVVVSVVKSVVKITAIWLKILETSTKQKTQFLRQETEFFFSSGDRIRTYDLWVMSPTSYQTAPPRDHLICYLFIKKLGGKLTKIKTIAKPRLHLPTIVLKGRKTTQSPLLIK